MRKINVIEFVSLDGVIEAPGGPEEDTSGPPWWIRPYRDPVSGAAAKKQMGLPFDLLLGHRTFEPVSPISRPNSTCPISLAKNERVRHPH
jgi:hypothetical protein